MHAIHGNGQVLSRLWVFYLVYACMIPTFSSGLSRFHSREELMASVLNFLSVVVPSTGLQTEKV